MSVPSSCEIAAERGCWWSKPLTHPIYEGVPYRRHIVCLVNGRHSGFVFTLYPFFLHALRVFKCTGSRGSCIAAVKDRQHPCPAARTYRRRRREAYGVHTTRRAKAFMAVGNARNSLSLVKEKHDSTRWERHSFIHSLALGQDGKDRRMKVVLTFAGSRDISCIVTCRCSVLYMFL